MLCSCLTRLRLHSPVDRPGAPSVHGECVYGSTSADGEECCTHCAAREHQLSHSISARKGCKSVTLLDWIPLGLPIDLPCWAGPEGCSD